MKKLIIITFLIILSFNSFSQTHRTRKNEVSLYIFTGYDFDKFYIFNNEKVYTKNLPFNEGYGISFEKRYKQKYFFKTNLSWWNVQRPWFPWKYIPKTNYESIFSKEGAFIALGFGKRIKVKKILTAKINSQIVYRGGLLTTYTGFSDLVDSHFYNDFGVNFNGECQLKITRFLALNLSAGYIFYFVRYDHHEGFFDDRNPITRHTIVLRSGLSFMF